jgi:hypothetical protein
VNDRDRRGRELGVKLAHGLRLHAQEVREEHDVDLRQVIRGAAECLDEWLDNQELFDRDGPRIDPE